MYKIRTKTMLGTHHSWAVTFRKLFNSFINNGHDCYLNSINGYKLCPQSWKPLFNREPELADIDICYTLPRNFPVRFKSESKLKLAVYNYETSILPVEWRDKHKYIDFALPSSNFSKDIFIQNGWPSEKCIVIPHGVDHEEFKDKSKVKLINDKSFRFLNVSIPHYRKNIGLLIEAYYDAFTSNDDVCLVIKTSLEPPRGRSRFSFELDVSSEIKRVQNKYIKLGRADLPQIEIFQERLESIVPLYNSCDVLVSATSSEGFGLPMLEALAANMLVVAPRATGQLDFLSDKNSLLVDVRTIKAGKEYQYWRASDEAFTYLPEKISLSEKMLEAFNNYKNLKYKFEDERKKVIKKFTWENAANKIIEIANENI